MPTTFQRADKTVVAFVKQVMEEHHERLIREQVTLDVLIASNDTGADVKLHGYPCLATVRIVGLRDRAKGQADAEILLSQRYWNQASAEQRAALIDHELTHLEPSGKVDSLDRPRLSLRRHDWQFGWFNQVVERHGEASVEATQARQLFEFGAQLYFPFAKQPKAGAPKRTGAAATAAAAAFTQ